ncbi:glycosyltransferase [Flavobacterium amnicola]|uniref:Glycosyltransferase n=1 Tax=Flavobacterium amnicola TaxID=2506422 RepID=A0A4Q1K2X3_9FLAO|nr:glycosyltransferase [Flavobacterium amnicola]RXR19089.1 glycosyltransferase [Flavobacterium amnicola]
MKNELPLVSIVCHTFNHEKYLEETIKGFLNQKVDFPIEIIIHDDASTDSTRAIINKYALEYPNLIKCIFQETNVYSKKINIWANYTFPSAEGKYIAICEGDDYWSDENKLQEQVNFLEQNDNFCICWTNYVTKTGNTYGESNLMVFDDYFKVDLNNIFDPYCTLTLTSVFRKDRLDLEKLNSLKHFKDNSLYLLLLKNGDGMFINKKTSVYRQHEGGVFSLKSYFFQQYSSYINIKELYDLDTDFQNENIKNTLRNLIRNAALDAVDIYFKNKSEFTKEMKGVIWKYFSSLSFKLKVRFIKLILKKMFKKK